VTKKAPRKRDVERWRRRYEQASRNVRWQDVMGLACSRYKRGPGVPKGDVWTEWIGLTIRAVPLLRLDEPTMR